MSFIPLHDISKLVEYKTLVGSRALVIGTVDDVDVTIMDITSCTGS